MEVAMKSGSLFAALVWGLAELAAAAEVKVLSAIAMRPVINELGPQFERASGHKLVLQFDTIGALRRKIDAGEPFDVTLGTGPLLGELINQGKVGGTRVDIARSGIGVFGRTSAPKPDLQSADAFKRAMLETKSITYTKDTPAASYLPTLFERLGIGEQMKAKTRLGAAPGETVESVASGQVELGFAVLSAFEPVADIQLLAPLPAELQNYTVYAGGVGAAAKEAAAGKALLDFLKAPAAAPVLRAKGMEPIGP